MARAVNLRTLSDKLLICAGIGLAMTVATGFYHHTILQQHCGSQNNDSNVIECSLEGASRGLPFGYVQPQLPKDEVVPGAFLGDFLIWSAIPAVFVLKPRKAHRG